MADSPEAARLLNRYPCSRQMPLTSFLFGRAIRFMIVGQGRDSTNRLPAPPPDRMRAEPRIRTAVVQEKRRRHVRQGGERTVCAVRRPLFPFAQKLLHLFPLEILVRATEIAGNNGKRAQLRILSGIVLPHGASGRMTLCSLAFERDFGGIVLACRYRTRLGTGFLQCHPGSDPVRSWSRETPWRCGIGCHDRVGRRSNMWSALQG